MKKSGTGLAYMDGRSLAVRENEDIAEDIGRFASRQELALYISDVTLQMRNLARAADMHFLAYLLEMAFQEAFDIGNGRRGQKGADA